ncbi:tetraacyldisaccharide 4'-kinase [Parabacteroides sp. PF5-9]|uniref:tetraacyldisaccharide 4'-kinase n=1 Tax=Parabacteroides sp. PF5-9 TaxID=1742404 RepID=UPI0024765E87|nr:tetraacyldisaccharide 4'-kinase [Parabacteroides sp. PF5-9]MDH6358388.1 tetraacyldisaccharide 4'-kinase [Parabacteroides sp. PF5-9]
MPIDYTIKLNPQLSPFSFLYGIAVRFRNQLFDWGILPSEEYDIPVICVGNIAVGGTGKTPHTEYIIRLLQPRYKNKIAVLSRGYKRKTSGYILANEQTKSRDIGDEPYQIKQKFPQIQVAVDANRRRGIQHLLKLPEEIRPEIILLDDGFQHRYVTPSLNIVLTDYHRLMYLDKLMPVGRLREPKSGIRRADVIIVTKCASDIKPIDFRIIEDHIKVVAHQTVFFTTVRYGEIKPVFSKNALPWVKRDIRKNDDVLVVSGIASPDGFIREIKRYSNQVTTLTFPDHHTFSTKDIEKIKNTFEQFSSLEKLIIVTEKDAARLRDMTNIPDMIKKRLYYQPIMVDFIGKNRTRFDELIKEHILTFSKNKK